MNSYQYGSLYLNIGISIFILALFDKLFGGVNLFGVAVTYGIVAACFYAYDYFNPRSES